MVTKTKTVIRDTPSEAEASAATESRSSAKAESNNNSSASTEQEILNTEWQNKLYSYCMCKHGGLVKLCRIRGCTNVEHFELRGGLCSIHQNQTGERKFDSSDDYYGEKGGCIDNTTTNEKGLCNSESNRYSTKNNGSHNKEKGVEKREEKKRVLLWDSIDSKKMEKRQRVHADTSVLDLSNVPPQLPIPKNKKQIKEGASKYTGVSFCKKKSKWKAQIRIHGKLRNIGIYENEKEAAIDYARAVFKYRGESALAPRARKILNIIDLSDVPPQPPISKSAHDFKKGVSKYVGVTFNENWNRWKARISIYGTQCNIGTYENEEEAASDYARAVFKYKGVKALARMRKQKSSSR